MRKIGVIGGGAWGTALAQVACSAGRQTVLWAREEEVAAAINGGFENTVYLPGVKLDPALTATTDLAAMAECDLLLLVAPAQHLANVAGQLAPHLQAPVPAVICAKGIEQQSLKLMSESLADVMPKAPLAVLSGPTFAIEVARGLPTAVTLACDDAALGEQMVAALGLPTFRPYLADDLIGAQIGGAVKNVLAIACGIVEGRGLGDNARAALITRGLAEILRLGRAKGARMETLMGLSGLGDLTLTCNSTTSRNFSLGQALGEGRTLDEVLGERRSVAEGVYTAAAVTELAARLGVEMPICAVMDGILNRGLSVDDAIEALLRRPFTTEAPVSD